MYDPATNTWTTKKPMPTPRQEFAIAVYQNKIYVIGGYLGKSGGYIPCTGLNQVYDPQTDTWENRTQMPTPRHRLCANVVNNKIYLIGGNWRYNGYPGYGPSSANEVYDPETDTWTTKTGLTQYQRVSNYASVVVDDKIYIFGGGWADFTQIYDTENDTWTSGEPVPFGFTSAAAGATTGLLAPKRIYVFGGFMGTYLYSSNLTQVYDPETNVWSTGTPMPTPRSRFAVAVVNDVLYIIGGGASVTYQYTPIEYIPEFPSCVILPLFLIISLVAVIIKRRVPHSKQNRNALAFSSS